MALRHKKRTIILVVIATVIVALVIAVAVYLNTSYPAGRRQGSPCSPTLRYR